MIVQPSALLRPRGASSASVSAASLPRAPRRLHVGLHIGLRPGLHMGLRPGLHLGLRVGLVLAACAAARSAPAQESFAPAVERAARGLAHVSVLFETKTGGVVRVERASSGFVIDPKGLLLTNEHLVDEIATGKGAPGEEYWLQVVLAGDRIVGAKVVARDERLDLALLALDLPAGERVEALELSPGGAPEPGVEAFALGRPRGNEWFALAGVVSLPNGPATLRQATVGADEALITDAAVLEEVDGGPFVDRAGRALGIVNTAQRTPLDPKADDTVRRDPLQYALILRADAVRRAFPEQLAAPKQAGAAPSTEPIAELVRQASPAVVSVWAGAKEDRPAAAPPTDPCAKQAVKSLGSGVIVDPAGLVITSYDTVKEKPEVSVRLADGREFKGRVLRTLPSGRIALVELELGAGEKVPALELASSADALAGESVCVLGNPYGSTPTVSAGVLAALEVEERLRVGGWVHDGHRGGALIDSTGRLIGIPLADEFKREEKQHGETYLGVALPIDRVREWCREEFSAPGRAPNLAAAPTVSASERARREDAVTRVVARTKSSLLNVLVSAEAPKSTGFDPFATPGETRPLGQGSGVVIDASGLAITNWHVVQPTLGPDGAQRSDHSIEVTLPNGERHVARVLATSRDDDLALIQLVLDAGETVVPVPLGTTARLSRGDPVIAIGNPYGKANTVTFGIVAAKDQDVQIAGRLHAYRGMLQTDAAINPGNSGGAMLDVDGFLIGINSAGRAGAGLAIPVERVRSVFGTKLVTAAGPFLGFAVEDASGGGVRVASVDQHGPAAKAGLALGDQVLRADGRAIASSVEWGNFFVGRAQEKPLELALRRDGAELELRVTPIDHSTWRVFRQTGIEVAGVDYAAETALVREGSIALHRAYTGIADGEPSRLMSGALRVVQVVPPRKGAAPDVRPGDLLLAASAVVRSVDGAHVKLVRFEDVAALREFCDAHATEKADPIDFWILRDGKVASIKVGVLRVR